MAMNRCTTFQENEDSDDDDNTLSLLFGQYAKYRLRNEVPRRTPPRNYGYYNTILRFNDRRFQSHFRMEPSTMDALENIVSPVLVRQGDTGRSASSPRHQLLTVCWLLATPDSYRLWLINFGGLSFV